MDAFKSKIKGFAKQLQTTFEANTEAISSNLPGRSTVTVNDRKLMIEKLLGEGGFAFVYLVKDVSGSSPFHVLSEFPRLPSDRYALKRILLQSSEQRAAFEHEVKVYTEWIARLHCPYILPLCDYSLVPSSKVSGAQDGLLLFPYCSGKTVQDVLPSLSLLDKRNIFLNVCYGLKALHSAQLAYRDLKPANILLDGERHAYLSDLGSVAPARHTIADRKEALALQDHCAQTCTAPFRAPELFEVRSRCTIDERTDIWSLGCFLYCLFYTVPPFDGSTTATLSGHVHFPSSPDIFCPPSVQHLIRCMLIVDPQHRPSIQSVIDLALQDSWHVHPQQQQQQQQYSSIDITKKPAVTPTAIPAPSPVATYKSTHPAYPPSQNDPNANSLI